MIVLPRRKRLVAIIASLWHNIALYQGNNLPLPGTKQYVGRFIKAPLFFLLFTLHQIGWNPDKHWGCERWRVAHHSSPLFTTLHLRIAHGIETEARPVRSGAETTFFMFHRFTQIFRVKSGWRVVKSGAPLFNCINPLDTRTYDISVKSEECFWKWLTITADLKSGVNHYSTTTYNIFTKESWEKACIRLKKTVVY